MDFYNLQEPWFLGSGVKLGSGFTLSPSDNHDKFEARSRARYRHPTFSIFAGQQGDITYDGIVAEYTRRAEDSLHEPNYGTGTITISDDEQRYVENGKSVFQVSQPIMVFAGFENQNIPRFSGIIREIQLQSSSRVQVLTIAEAGYKLRKSKTSGDYSSYNSPKLLANYLTDLARIGDVVYENESGPPTTFLFGDTQLELRDYWAMIHGCALCIGYIQHFDEKGRLNLTRRTSFYDTGYVFTDSEIEHLSHFQQADLINHKTIDFVKCITPGFLAGDNIHPGQHTKSRIESMSKHKYGEYEDQETDELIGTYTNAGKIIDQTLDYFPFPRQIYLMKTPALPQLQIADRIFISSVQTGIEGYFIFIGIKERASITSYSSTCILISAGERF